MPSVQNAVINSPSDYQQLLSQMWGLHLAKRSKDAPTIISTFAGGGGSSLGYSMAGCDERLAIEWDGHAVETFKLNFPDIPVFHGDIGTLSINQCLEMAEVRTGELDLLDGSPPCQGFSIVNTRQYKGRSFERLEDSRNQLFLEFCRLLEGLQPKVFIMENVSGMIKGKMKLIFAEIMRELKKCGYQVSARLLDAMYFNVPQSRKRIIFVGVRNNLAIKPSHPVPGNIPITVKQVLPDLKSLTAFDLEDEPPPLKGKYLEVWSAVPPGRGVGYLMKKQRRVWKKGSKLGGGNHSVQKIDPNKPSFTLKRMVTIDGFMTVVHWQKPRALSISEAKTLTSFPSEYKTKGSYQQQWGVIGNSVPPLMMFSIARHIRTKILNECTKNNVLSVPISADTESADLTEAVF